MLYGIALFCLLMAAACCLCLFKTDARLRRAEQSEEMTAINRAAAELALCDMRKIHADMVRMRSPALFTPVQVVPHADETFRITEESGNLAGRTG